MQENKTLIRKSEKEKNLIWPTNEFEQQRIQLSSTKTAVKIKPDKKSNFISVKTSFFGSVFDLTLIFDQKLAQEVSINLLLGHFENPEHYAKNSIPTFLKSLFDINPAMFIRT